MKIKCEYCNSFIDSSCTACPNCGGVNKNAYRVHEDVPGTMDELKAYCIRHNLPLDAMGVHIGEDYRGAKAFGIYKDEATGEFVVYKNKADGTRAVRYQGTDEAFAVNELYLKCRERVSVQRAIRSSEQKAGRQSNGFGGRSGRATGSGWYLILFIVIFIVILTQVAVVAMTMFKLYSYPEQRYPRQGYYSYDDTIYYYYNNDWYQYEDDWRPADDSIYIDEDNWNRYYEGSGYDQNYDATDFRTTDYYESGTSGQGSYDRNDDNWGSYNWNDDNWGSDDWDNTWDWNDSYDDWDSDW